VPPGDYNVEILCEADDAQLLLERARRSYPDAIPYIQSALGSVRHTRTEAAEPGGANPNHRGGPAMELRNHSVMFCDGVRQWPPKWLQTYGRGTVSVSGEVGVLEAVFLSQVVINKVYLLMHTVEGNAYLGTLIFEKLSSAKAVFDFLQGCINKPLSAIGALDLPDNFGS